MDELHEAAERNRFAFERALAKHVRLKLTNTLERHDGSKRAGWFDATGCVWCLFDDEAFARSGTAGREAQAAAGNAFDLQLFWSVEDVLMPVGCDERWVAERIAAEATRQLEAQGFLCKPEEREPDKGLHLGVAYRRPRGLERIWSRNR